MGRDHDVVAKHLGAILAHPVRIVVSHAAHDRYDPFHRQVVVGFSSARPLIDAGAGAQYWSAPFGSFCFFLLLFFLFCFFLFQGLDFFFAGRKVVLIDVIDLAVDFYFPEIIAVCTYQRDFIVFFEFDLIQPVFFGDILSFCIFGYIGALVGSFKKVAFKA